MSEDDEILQDFILEVREILEQLSEQLVDLEQRPDDKELLNAIFRGFHTVKGGAGFLHLEPMVECCHATETLFGILRSGKRAVTAELMDVALQALDTVSIQFMQVSEGRPIMPATPELIGALENLANTDETKPAEISHDEDEDEIEIVTPASNEKENDDAGNLQITDEKFRSYIDAIRGEKNPGNDPEDKTNGDQPASIKAGSQEISDDEFEALLDELHGTGKAPGVAEEDKHGSDKPVADTVSDDEFDRLLDQLHGKGNGPTKGSTKVPAEVSAEVPAKGASAEQIPPTDQSAIADSPLEPKSRGSSTTQPTAVDSVSPSLKVVPEPVAKNSIAASSSASGSESTVRVDIQRLDNIMNMVGELVLVRNRLVRLGEKNQDEAMQKAIANLDVVTADLQSAVMKTRMQPIKKVFGRFPRLVRDLSRSLKKEINLELEGEETDLDKNLVEALADPLIHLVRNSVDHGIEFPVDRESKGKPRAGTISLSAQQEGDHILLSIVDDGRGINASVLKKKAIENGILDAEAADRMDDKDVFDLIFSPGFSTKEIITDLSGRGVGMDVVKSKINQLNGAITIESKLGEGTKIFIRVPLTLAIMPTLMIMLNNQIFALPLASVNEIFRFDASKSHIVDGQQCITIRNKAIPVFALNNWLRRSPLVNTRSLLMKESETEVACRGEHIVIVSVGSQNVGLVVDQLIGQEEVVIKPLGKMLHGTPGMAGATITGDGTIALILDIPGMLDCYAKSA